MYIQVKNGEKNAFYWKEKLKYQVIRQYTMLTSNYKLDIKFCTNTWMQNHQPYNNLSSYFIPFI